MKKFLISAASIAVLTTGVAAHADHNYVGLGLGWTTINASGKQESVAGGTPTNAKKNSKDTSAISGAFIFGRHLGRDLDGAFVELRIGKDSSNAKSAYKINDGASLGQTDVSLKRNFFINTGLGYSKSITSDMTVYGKIALSISKFQLWTTMYANGGIGGISQGRATKKITSLGFSPAVGLTKVFNGNFSLSIDYTVDFYKKMKVSGLWANSMDPRDGASAIAKPVYHTVMLGLTKKI